MEAVATAVNSTAITAFIKYTSQLAGRDKVLRTTQYLSRFLIYLLRRRPDKQWLATLIKLQGAMSTTRKIMRMGKFVEFLQLLLRVLLQRGDSGGDEITQTLNAGHKAGMFAFMLYDTVGILHSGLGLIALKDPKRIGRVAQRGWLVALACQGLAAAYELRALSLRETDVRRVRRHLEKSADIVGDRECVVEERAIAQRKQVATRQLVASALDLAIPVKGLDILPLNEGAVALAGTVTSLMGVRDILSKTLSRN